jgi:hypothetical protein
MDYPKVAVLLIAIGVATLMVIAAATRVLGGPYESLRRMLLPFLWIGSREWSTSFSQFSRSGVFTRKAWFGAWVYLALLAWFLVSMHWMLRS